MTLTPSEHLKARQYQAGGMSYTAIGKKLNKTADDIRDALIPGWRVKRVYYGRYARELRP